MPNTNDYLSSNDEPPRIVEAWVKFINSSRILFVLQPDLRPLDQFLEFKDTVLDLVVSEPFLAELGSAWEPFTEQPLIVIGDALILELKSFTRAMEVIQTMEHKTEKKSLFKRGLEWFSTGTGSVKDIMSDQLEKSPLVKYGLILAQEGASFFKGSDS